MMIVLGLLTGISLGLGIWALLAGHNDRESDFYGGMWKDRYIVIAITTFMVALFLGVVTIAQGVEQNQCHWKQSVYHRETRWNFWSGCYIDAGNGQYVDLGTYLTIRQGK